MKIKNVSGSELTIIDIKGSGLGGALTLSDQEVVVIYNEDAEKSFQLKKLLDQSLVTKLADDEPSDSTSIASPSSKLETLALANDKLVQFIKDNNSIATSDPEIFTATHNVAKSIRLAITDGDGTRDLLNSSSTFLISASGGTVNSASSATITFTDGLATVSIFRATAGNVNLVVSAVTHPLSAAVPPTTVTAASAAQVQFS